LGDTFRLEGIELPSSVERSESNGFLGCTLLRVVIIGAGCRMRSNEGFGNIKIFLVHEHDDMKTCRRLVDQVVGIE
jgi:hypothetical protein